MSSDGELYISETCRDEFKEQLDKEFGEGKWCLDGSEYSEVWNLKDLPLSIPISVLSEEDYSIIGVVELKSEAVIVESSHERWIDMKPVSISIQHELDYDRIQQKIVEIDNEIDDLKQQKMKFEDLLTK